MPPIALDFETCRAVVAELRAEGLPRYMPEHADRIERMLDAHGPARQRSP